MRSLLAYDGAPNISQLTHGLVGQADLTKDIRALVGPHDWTLSLEVGEHLDVRHEDTFLANVVANVHVGSA